MFSRVPALDNLTIAVCPVMDSRTRRFKVVDMADRVLPIRKLAVRRPPFEEWLASLRDPWLKAKIEEHIAQGDVWSIVVAAAMIGRLSEEPFPITKSAKEALAVRRPMLDRDASIRSWQKAMTAEEREDVYDLASVEIEALEGRFEGLAQNANAMEESGEINQTTAWKSELVALCHQREEIEGVVLGLEGTIEGASLRERLDAFDHTVTPFVWLVLAGESAPHVEDEILRRVWLLEPDKWWGAPASLGDGDEE